KKISEADKITKQFQYCMQQNGCAKKIYLYRKMQFCFTVQCKKNGYCLCNENKTVYISQTKFFVMLQFKKLINPLTWHDKHIDSLTFGQRLADSVATGMGSWRFIIIQTIIVAFWMILNVIAFIAHWDPYPFILLNLLFSTQAAYAAPIIMMAQNRQNERDRAQA